MDTTHSKILTRVKSKKPKWVFTPTDFLDIGNRTAIDKSLSRLVKDGHIRRLARGLYDVPRYNPYLDKFGPADPHQIMKAIVRRDKIKVVSDNIVHANGLGFTNAVPAKLVYLTNGPSKIVRVDGYPLRFKHTTASFMAAATKKSGPLFQALTWLGKDIIGSDNFLHTIKAKVGQDVLDDAKKNLTIYPAWMKKTIDKAVA
jgi:predicted transcriptional regulator of viral defense system